jgi:hypothetical protein
MGEFFQLPLVLFKISVRSGSTVQRVKAVFEKILPNDPRASFFPFTKLAIEHWKLIQKSELTSEERFHAFWDIVFCFFLKYKTFLLDPAITAYLNLMKLRRPLVQ